MRGTFTRFIGSAGPLGLALALATGTGRPPLAAPAPDEILYESEGLRILRTASTRGAPIVLLTNLDDEGNRLAGPGATTDDDPRGPLRHDAPEPGPPPPPVTASARPDEAGPPKTVRIVVRQDGGDAPASEREVEVQSDADGGTVVIVNVTQPPAPPRETVIVPAPSYAPVAYVGLPGPIRYPDRLYFLGYGPTNNTPVFFGGLGLDSTDRYARAACGVSGTGPGCAPGSRTPAP